MGMAKNSEVQQRFVNKTLNNKYLDIVCEMAKQYNPYRGELGNIKQYDTFIHYSHILL